MIGALAIGELTFGVTAGTGLVIGEAVGGVVGAGIARGATSRGMKFTDKSETKMAEMTGTQRPGARS